MSNKPHKTPDPPPNKYVNILRIFIHKYEYVHVYMHVFTYVCIGMYNLRTCFTKLFDAYPKVSHTYTHKESSVKQTCKHF
jgi:hypothetical protein